MPRTPAAYVSIPQKEETADKPEDRKFAEVLLGKKKKATGFEWRYVGGCLLYLERAGGGHGVGIQVWAVLVVYFLESM